MKKLIFIISLFCAFSVKAQTNIFPSVDSAKNYALRYVRNSTVESFTNLRMQQVVVGTLELLDSLTAISGGSGVDSIWLSSSATKDTIKYSISGYTYTAATLDKASLRVAISDSAAMLSGYVRVQRFLDSLSAHTSRFDAVTSSLALKLNITDTANIKPRLYAGSNVTITGTYPNQTIAASGGGGSADSSLFVTNTILQNRVDSIMRVMFPNGAGENVKVFAGVMYPTWNGSSSSWDFYRGGSGHAVLGYTSINASGNSLQLGHTGVDSVIACIVGVDETLQKYDITIGASAGYSDVTIQGSIPLMVSRNFLVPDFTAANSFTLNMNPAGVTIIYDTTNMRFTVDWSSYGLYALQQPHVYAANYYGTDGVNNIMQRMPDNSTYVQKFKYPVDPLTGYKKPKYLCTNDDNFIIDYTYRGPLSFTGIEYPTGANFWIIEIVIDK